MLVEKCKIVYCAFHEDMCRNGGAVPLVLNITDIWIWLVSYTPRLFDSITNAHGSHLLCGWVELRTLTCSWYSWFYTIPPSVSKWK